MKDTYYKPCVDSDFANMQMVLLHFQLVWAVLSKAVLAGNMDRAREIVREHQDILVKRTILLKSKLMLILKMTNFTRQTKRSS